MYAHVAGRAVRVDRDADRSDVAEREVEERPLERRAREDPEGVALADAQREEAVGEQLDPLGRLGPRDLAPAVLGLDEVRGRPCSRDGVAPEARNGPVRHPTDCTSAEGKRCRWARTLRSAPRLGRVMRLIWNGSLSFGLVSIPVGLAPATKPAARSPTCVPHCSTASARRRSSRSAGARRTSARSPPTRSSRAGRCAKGQFVIVEEDELEALERHDDSRTIDIERFVPLGDVDPVWMDRTYFLVPAQRRRSAGRTSSARGDGGGGVGGDRTVRPLGHGIALPRPAAGARPRARDALPRRGRLLPGRDRGGDGGDRGQGRRARPRAADRRGPPRPSSTRRSSRALPRRPPRDARGEAARRGDRRPEPLPEPAPAVDLIEALKASVAAAKASSARPKKAAAKPKAEKRPARKAARK